MMFSPPDRYQYASSRVPPPKVHLAAYVTGGLKKLYTDIDAASGKPSHDYGKYTDKSGQFSPDIDMTLLACRYEFVKVLGKGQSSVCIEAKDTFCNDTHVSIKILHTNYHMLGPQEGFCVSRLNAADPYMYAPTLRLQNVFLFDDHYCMVFELLIAKPLTHYFRELPPDKVIDDIRKVSVQLLKAIGFMQQQNVIHADLKPDNILLANDDVRSMKVVDFGNAIHCTHEEMSLYYENFDLQTLLYRAPEVMFGMAFGLEVDMWSLGCVLAELYVGSPFFQGDDKIAILHKMYTILGPFPSDIYCNGKFSKDLSAFTDKRPDNDNVANSVLKDYLDDYMFTDFVSKLLHYDPRKRLTVQQAACHPFLAPELGINYLTNSGPGYETILLNSSNYHSKPEGAQSLLPTNGRKPQFTHPPKVVPMHPTVCTTVHPTLDTNHNVTYLTSNNLNHAQKTANKDVTNNNPISNALKDRYKLHLYRGIDQQFPAKKRNIVIVYPQVNGTSVPVTRAHTNASHSNGPTMGRTNGYSKDHPMSHTTSRPHTDYTIGNCSGRTIKYRHSVATASKPLILREYRSVNQDPKSHVSHAPSRRSQCDFVVQNGTTQHPSHLGQQPTVVRRRREYYKTELGKNHDEACFNAHGSQVSDVLQVLHTTNPTLESHLNGSKKIKTEKSHSMKVQQEDIQRGDHSNFTALLNTTRGVSSIPANEVIDSVKQYYKDRSRTTVTKKVVDSSQMLNATFTYPKPVNHSGPSNSKRRSAPYSTAQSTLPADDPQGLSETDAIFV